MKRSTKIMLLAGAAVIAAGSFVAFNQATAQPAGAMGQFGAYAGKSEANHGPRGFQRAHSGGQRGPGFHGRGGPGGPHGMRGERLFETFDADSDKRITQAEIDTFRKGQFDKHDADKNGTLTLSEYQALWLEVMRERMVDAFQRHDDDGDAVVTLDEFSKRFSNMVSRMDRDGDGAITSDDMGMRFGQGPRRGGDGPGPRGNRGGGSSDN